MLGRLGGGAESPESGDSELRHQVLEAGLVDVPGGNIGCQNPRLQTRDVEALEVWLKHDEPTR